MFLSVKEMEMDEFFNAGNGAVLNGEKIIEMDASIMDGRNLKVGCVTGTSFDNFISIKFMNRILFQVSQTFFTQYQWPDESWKELPTIFCLVKVR